MSFALVDYLQKGRFSNSRFVDAADMVDRIKAIKSAEERELIRRTAAMQDGAMRAAFAAIKPGMRDRDVAAIAQCYSQRHGSENGIYLCASMPPDTPSAIQPAPLPEPRHPRRRRGRAAGRGFRPGRHVCRAWPHLRASARPRPNCKDEFAFALEARKFNLGLLKPGTPCADIFAAYNDFMRRNGRPEERRLHCHGQGYDLVERPLIRSDEPMTIAKDMNIVVHPTYMRGHVLSWVCDNYLIEADGPPNGCTASRRRSPNWGDDVFVFFPHKADETRTKRIGSAGRHFGQCAPPDAIPRLRGRHGSESEAAPCEAWTVKRRSSPAARR